MAQHRERRVKFSSDQTESDQEGEAQKSTNKKDTSRENMPSPILKVSRRKSYPPPASDLLIDFDEEKNENDKPLIEFVDDDSTSQPAAEKDVLESPNNVSDKNFVIDEYNTATVLRRRNRQLMKQYIMHRDSLSHSGSETDQHDQSFASEENANSETTHLDSSNNKNPPTPNGGTPNKNNDSIKPKVQNGKIVNGRSNSIAASKKLESIEIVQADTPVVPPTVEYAESELTNDDEESWTSHCHDGYHDRRKGFGSATERLCIPQLDGINRFAVFDISSSKQNWGQKFLGFDWLDNINLYKFVVLDNRENVLFVGITGDKASLSKGFFDMTLTDPSGLELIHFRRIYALKTNTLFEVPLKKRCRLEVMTPTGYVIGNVEKTYNNENYYILEDRAGDCVFLIKRKCVTIECPLLWDYEFKILLPDCKNQIGEISWSCLTAHQENFYGTEISFPENLTYSSKSLLLGACFLLNCSRRHGAFLYKRRSSNISPWKCKTKLSQGLLGWHRKKSTELVSSYRAPSTFQNETETTKLERECSEEEEEKKGNGFRQSS